MDSALLHHTRAFVGRAHSRALALSRDAQSRWSGLTLLSGVVGRRAMTGSLFLAGICLAVLAYDATARETLLSWKRQNIPQPLVWKLALGSRGYRELQENGLFQKALKSLPSQMDRPGQVWIGRNSAWLAVFHSGASAPVTLYCRACRAKPDGWEPLEEIGWDALSPALAQAERLSKLEMPKTRAETRDPRAIYY